MAANATPKKVLVLGVGNTLLQDDGIGVHVTQAFRDSPLNSGLVEILDGGTIGLSLLPQIEEADGVIVVDAGEIGEQPGAIRIFHNAEIDMQLSGKKRSVHEVAVADLFAAASIRGHCPVERALIAIQPGSTELGLSPTPEVQAAITPACDALNRISMEWLDEA